MRLLLLGAPFLAALSVPAAAAPVDPVDAEIAAALPSREEMAGLGDMLGRIMGAMLDVEIGGLIDAIDPAAQREGRESQRTIRDIAGHDDPYLEERMQRSARAAAENMGDVMTDIAILTPRLRRSFEAMSRDIEDAVRDLPDPRR